MILSFILLHDHFEGCIEIANPEGLISSQGAKHDDIQIPLTSVKKAITFSFIAKMKK